MTLKARVADLRTAAIAADDVVQIQSRTGELRALHTRLSSLVENLPKLVAALSELATIELTLDADVKNDCSETVSGIQSLAATIESLPINAPLDTSKAQVKAVENLAKELGQFITVHWQGFLGQDIPPINEELIDALADGGVDVENVRQDLNEAQSDIVILKARVYPREGDFARFSAAVEKLHACGEQVSTLVDPDLAEGILKAQSNEGIPVAWFTAGRIAEIEKLGILERFTVRLQ